MTLLKGIINKIFLNNKVLIDLSNDTVEQNDVKRGKSFHNKDGKQLLGTCDLETELVTLQQEKTTLQQEHTTLQQEHTILQQEHSTLQNDWSNLLRDYNNLFQEYNVLENRFNNLQTEYNNLQTDYNTLFHNYESLNQENLLLRNDYNENDDIFIVNGEDIVHKNIYGNDKDGKIMDITTNWNE